MIKRIAIGVMGALILTMSASPVRALAGTRHLVGVWPGLDDRRCASTASRVESLKRFEACIGRDVDIVRGFHRWTKEDAFPNKLEVAARDTGHRVLTGLNPVMRKGRPATWESIANGERNTVIDRWANGIKNFGRVVYFTFNHEPEDDIDTHGTPKQFIAAWRYIKDRFTTLGVTNIRYVWTMMAYTWQASTRSPGEYWVGSTYTDFIGANGYNWGPCAGLSGWRSMGTIYDPVYEWAMEKGKQIMATELGVTEDRSKPGRKGKWFVGMRKWLASHPEFRAIIYFNKRKVCTWPIDSSQSSREAFAAYAAWAAAT